MAISNDRYNEEATSQFNDRMFDIEWELKLKKGGNQDGIKSKKARSKRKAS